MRCKHLTTPIVLALVVAGWSPPGLAQIGGAPVAPPGAPTALADTNTVPEGLSDSEWSSIREAYEAGRHQAVAVEGGHRARNPCQQWTTLFDGRGFTTSPDAGGWTWGLQLSSYGWGAAEAVVAAPAAVTADGQRVSYAWDDQLTEWYMNDQRGLEHGYTVNARPEDAGGALTLELAIRGCLLPVVSTDGRDVRFVDATGGAVLTYAGLSVFDADGRALAADWQAAGPGLRLRIEDQAARYPLTIDPVAQQAYLKASNTEPFNPTQSGEQFGEAVAVSGDTVVVGAPFEDSAATGVNGDQSSNAAGESGAAYVFVRSGTTWTQQAYLKASNTEESDAFGIAVAIWGDTVVVGADREASAATGVNGNQSSNAAPDSGAAYVFVRSGTTWTQQAYLKASNTGILDFFGFAVAVSGNTVVIGAYSEASAATGVNGNQSSNAASAAGAAYVFVRSGTTWTQQAYLKASNTGAFDHFGHGVAVSGDTLVVGAESEDSAATGVDGDQGSNAVSHSGAAYVFVRSGTTWAQEAYLKASNTGVNDLFGSEIAMSGDTVVVGAFGEDSAATGVDGDQGSNAAENGGAAYVFERSGTTWTQQAYLKASNTATFDSFGRAVAVSADTVVVGAAFEDSAATGVNGNQSSNAASDSGAAYVFVRNGTTWTQQAYLKASNTGANDLFGQIAVSGATVVVGAPLEDSGASGVNGNQSSNASTAAGGAYVFDLDVPDPWVDLGGGTSGVAGLPLLVMSGPLTEFTQLSLDLVDGAPAALAILFLSFSSTPASFLGGTLHAFPYDELVVIGTDGAGEIHGAVTFPPGVPAGTELWFQVGMADASVPIYGASLSNGVKGTVP